VTACVATSKLTLLTARMIALTSIHGRITLRKQRDRNFLLASLFSRDINPRSLALFMRNEPFTLCHARARFYSVRLYYKALREMTFAGGDTFDNDRQIDGRKNKCRLSVITHRKIRHLTNKCNTRRSNSAVKRATYMLKCSVTLEFSNREHICPTRTQGND